MNVLIIFVIIAMVGSNIIIVMIIIIAIAIIIIIITIIGGEPGDPGGDRGARGRAQAPVQVAEKRGVLAIGQASDMSSFGPKAHLTSIIDNWGPYYVSRTKAVINKNWKSQDTWHGFKEGMVQLAPYNKVLPAKVIALAEKTRKGIMAGTIHPFSGEIKDQAGKVRVQAGKRANDGMLAGMNFYVQGIEGSIPK